MFWMLAAVLCALFAAFCAFLAFSNWQDGFDTGYRRAIKNGSGVDTMRFAEELATLLDVQADGGDSPVAYMRWAIKEAKKLAANPTTPQPRTP